MYLVLTIKIVRNREGDPVYRRSAWQPRPGRGNYKREADAEPEPEPWHPR